MPSYDLHFSKNRNCISKHNRCNFYCVTIELRKLIFFSKEVKCLYEEKGEWGIEKFIRIKVSKFFKPKNVG